MLNHAESRCLNKMASLEEHTSTEAVAIVGLRCKSAGKATGPWRLWTLLTERQQLKVLTYEQRSCRAAIEKKAVVVLTAATGSLGSHLAACLASQPEVGTVVCVNRRRRTPVEQRQMEAVEPQFQSLRNFLDLARDMACANHSLRVNFQLLSSIVVVGHAPGSHICEERVSIASVLPIFMYHFTLTNEKHTRTGHHGVRIGL